MNKGNNHPEEGTGEVPTLRHGRGSNHPKAGTGEVTTLWQGYGEVTTLRQGYGYQPPIRIGVGQLSKEWGRYAWRRTTRLGAGQCG